MKTTSFPAALDTARRCPDCEAYDKPMGTWTLTTVTIERCHKCRLKHTREQRAALHAKFARIMRKVR